MHGEEFKDALRADLLEARARVTAAEWALGDAARAGLVLDRIPGDTATVALYAARPGEPGTRVLIDALVAGGRRVLLPVLRRRVDWAWFDSWEAMRPAWADIPEPTGKHLGAAALALADLIFVPCLAIGRDGSRLGTGGGWYDRALPHRRDGVTVVALARAQELLDSVPTLPHDVHVDAVVTETEWVKLARRSIMDG